MRRAQLHLLPPVQPIAGRVPPHDLDAEAAVISAALLDASAAVTALEILDDPARFYSEANGRIWEAIAALIAEGTPVDIVTVASWLRDRGRLVAVGGAGYLAQLADATPAVANVGSHARTVHEKWRVRQAIALCQRVSAEGYGDVGAVQDFLDGLAESAEAIARSMKSGKGPTRLSDAFAETMRDVLGFEAGKLSGYSTGLASLDELTGGLHGGEIVLLKARRKVGKSALCGQIAATIAGQPEKLPEDPDKPGVARWQWRGALILALEGKVRDWSSRMGCAHGRVDYSAIRTGTATPDDIARLSAAAARLADLPIAIDDRKDLTPARLVARVRAQRDAFARSGVELSLVVLDNMQLWPTPGDDRRDRRVILDDAMQAILRLAAAEDMQRVAWVVVSQVNADGDARDCKAIEAHADALWGLSADKESTADADGAVAARVTVEAQRRGPQGKNAPFWFYPKWTLFWDRG